MTRVDFHFTAPDKGSYACRLVRKIFRSGHQAVVWHEDESELAAFDKQLWTFAQHEFIPHVMHDHALASETPVVLACRDLDTDHHDVIVNLGAVPPPVFGRFERLIEIVTTATADKEAARERWRFYRDRGYAMTRHDLSATRA